MGITHTNVILCSWCSLAVLYNFALSHLVMFNLIPWLSCCLPSFFTVKLLSVPLWRYFKPVTHSSSKFLPLIISEMLATVFFLLFVPTVYQNEDITLLLTVLFKKHHDTFFRNISSYLYLWNCGHHLIHLVGHSWQLCALSLIFGMHKSIPWDRSNSITW